MTDTGNRTSYSQPINLCLSTRDIETEVLTAIMYVCNSDLKSVNLSYYKDKDCKKLKSTKVLPKYQYIVLDCGGSVDVEPCNYFKYQSYETDGCRQYGGYDEKALMLNICNEYEIDLCISNDQYVWYLYPQPNCVGDPVPYYERTGCIDGYYQNVECNNQTSK